MELSCLHAYYRISLLCRHALYMELKSSTVVDILPVPLPKHFSLTSMENLHSAF